MAAAVDQEAAEDPVASNAERRQRSFLPGHLVALLILAVITVVLVRSIGVLGVLLATAIVIAGIFIVLRRDSAHEVEALRRSVSHSAADIAEVLDDWHTFRHSNAPEHVRDRELHRPALLDPASEIVSVKRFHDAADACDRFLRQLPDGTRELSDVSSLTELLNETDRRATGIDGLWERARRDAAAAPR